MIKFFLRVYGKIEMDRLSILEQMVFTLQKRVNDLEIQVSMSRSQYGKIKCDVCKGQGGFDISGRPCNIGNMMFDKTCAVCNGNQLVI
jgi:DnaJ-class molecular chaperone